MSADSVDPGTASRLTRNLHFSERTAETVANLVSAGLAPRVKCVLTGLNHTGAEDLVDRFVHLGVTAFQFVQYGRSHYRHRDELFLGQEQKLRVRDAMDLHPERQRFAGTACFTCRDFDGCHGEQGYCYRDALFHYGSPYVASPDCPRQWTPPLRAI